MFPDAKQHKDILVSVPSFTRSLDIDGKNVVLYDVQFTELQSQYAFVIQYRYSELKKFNESLETLKVTLPAFPKTSWFSRSNDDPAKVEDRRITLNAYFQNLVGIKQVRESFLFKNFITDAKLERDKRQSKIQNQQIKEENKLKKSPQLKFQTPEMEAEQEPQFEKKRALSLEHNKNPDHDHEKQVHTKAERLKHVHVGGRGLMKGMLHNTKK